jgi:adenine-specific DNA-methyltransferase
MPRRKKEQDATNDKMREIDAYTHEDKKRSNNPPVGMAQYDVGEEQKATYQYDPHIDPQLEWAGKAERLSFEVPTVSLHIHETINPFNIIKAVRNAKPEDPQLSFFEHIDPMKARKETLEFYKHKKNWTNRLIAGDSLYVMNSLIEKEGMAGQVQMVYIDPPYGIKYGSNFQPFVDNRDVKDGKDDDLTQEPEMIEAFRDTWELGIHSYLTYLRDRLLLARDLLADTGSVFVQISDENVHYVRSILEEIFKRENFVCQICYQTAPYATSNTLPVVHDYILWYAKDKKQLKYHQLFKDKTELDSLNLYRLALSPDGKEYRTLTKQEMTSGVVSDGWKRYRLVSMVSQGASSEPHAFEFEGKKYYPATNSHWKVRVDALDNVAKVNRIQATPNSIQFRSFIDDFPISVMHNIWTDTITGSFNDAKVYVVQTGTKAIQRCMLMSTDPGDLVLDITCGSGTTAVVAEEWGRRWITCDTSRVAITLAKQRLMTATFEYYQLAHPEQGVGSGFVYKMVPHITLGSIANNEPPQEETLYDQPIVDKTKMRVSGPFTVEALPAPIVKPIDALNEPTASDESLTRSGETGRQTEWRDELLATGIRGKNGQIIEFSRVEPLSGTRYLQAEAETKEDKPRRAVICFANENRPLDSRMVDLALREAEDLHPSPKMIIFSAFQFDPEAAKDIDDANWPGVTLLKAQMNTDLLTEDLKKKRSNSQSFWLVGQPDVELVKIQGKGKDKGKYKVIVHGFDYYDVKKGTVESGDTGRIAMWMLDTDYDGMCIKPQQVFFPMAGSKDGWGKLAKTLKAEINQDLIEQYRSNESLPFTANLDTQIAVKIIDDRGIESLKIIKMVEGD